MRLNVSVYIRSKCVIIRADAPAETSTRRASVPLKLSGKVRLPQKNTRTFIYLGGGAFGGQWDEEFSLGVAAVAGIEYTLRDLPLNFSLDWKPMLNIYAVFEPDWLDFGLSIRYRFKK